MRRSIPPLVRSTTDQLVSTWSPEPMETSDYHSPPFNFGKRGFLTVWLPLTRAQ